MNLCVIFPPGVTALTVNGLCQWDYGRKLEIQVDDMPETVEVHFACPGMTEAEVRRCENNTGVVEVAIPDKCLEQTAPIKAWVFAINGAEGFTAKTVTLNVSARTRPKSGAAVPEEHHDQYTSAVDALVRVYAEKGPAAVAKRALLAERTPKANHATLANYARSADTVESADTSRKADRVPTATHATQVQNVTEATDVTEASIVEQSTSADAADSAESAATATIAEDLEGIDGTFELTYRKSSSRFYTDNVMEPGIYLLYVFGRGQNLYSQPFVVYFPPSGISSGAPFFYSTPIPFQFGTQKYYCRIHVSYDWSYVGYRFTLDFSDVYNHDTATGNLMPNFINDIGCADGTIADLYYKKILDS